MCTITMYMYMYLWIRCLSEDVSHSVGMTSEGVYAGLSPHVPHTSSRIPPSSQQHIDSGMQGHAVHTTEVPMVVTYYLSGEMR